MRRSRVVLATAAAALLLSCSRPPQADIDAARAALGSAAQSADVVTYAPDSLRAAQEEAAAFEAELSAQMKKPGFMRRFDAVRGLAVKAAELAAAAQADAAQAKAEVALDAAMLADEVTAAIPTVESKVWAAKRVPRIKLDIVATIGLVPAQARATVEDARQDIAAGDFATAKAKLLAVKDQLTRSEETLIEQTRIAKSR
jgi:hypothetical protein